MPAVSNAAVATIAIDRALSALAQIDAAADAVTLTRARLVVETELAAARAFLAPPPAPAPAPPALAAGRRAALVAVLVLGAAFALFALSAGQPSH